MSARSMQHATLASTCFFMSGGLHKPLQESRDAGMEHACAAYAAIDFVLHRCVYALVFVLHVWHLTCQSDVDACRPTA
jgi:hypothetical protein